MPSGAAVQWSIVGSGASISGCSTCTTVSVCRNTSTNTIISLKATVLDCSFTYTKEYSIVLGKPPIPTIQYVTYYGSDVGLGALIIPDAVYNWYEGGVLTEAGGGPSYVTTVACGSSRFVQVEAVNACGVSPKAGKGLSGQCGGSSQMLVSPNPANDNITVSLLEGGSQLKNKTSKAIFEIAVLDKMGNVKIMKKYKGDISPINLYIGTLKPDIYIIKVFDSKQWLTQQLVVE